jgi:phosphoglycolate phosphatase
MTNRPYDLMLFDLDGTLVETAPEIMDAVNDTLGHFKLSLVTQQQVNDWIGHGTLTLLVQAVADRSGMTVEAVRASELLQTMVPVYDGFTSSAAAAVATCTHRCARPCTACARRVSSWRW